MRQFLAVSRIWQSYALLVWVIVICVAVELVLIAGDFGLFGSPRFRAVVYEYAAFWPGLMRDWQSNYAGQSTLMFVTYGFLHGGISHLLVNMFTLWSAGTMVIDRVGSSRFALLYAASILGGGVGYALLASGPTPMVGASGAIFGVIGGLLSWSYIDLVALRQNLWPVARAVLFLIALNLVLWWAMDGQLAWQTHLGGFLAGWLFAYLIDPDPHSTEPE